MSWFVAECRREWKRIGVADAVAEEMADELAADLSEAEAEGASVADVLGSSALDPLSFAAAWATARGLTATARARRPRRWRPPISVVVGGLVLLVVLAAAALIVPGTGALVVRGHHGTGAALRAGVPGRVVSGTTAVDLHPLGWAMLVVSTLGLLASGIQSRWSGAKRWTHASISS